MQRKYFGKVRLLCLVSRLAISSFLNACAFIGIRAPITPETLDPQTGLTEQSQISFDGIGPIKVGMTVAEAEAAAGIELVGYGDSILDACAYIRPEVGFPELDFMVFEDRIARVDIRNSVSQIVDGQPTDVNVGEQSQLSTVNGIGLGDSEAQVKATYPAIEITEHKYIPGGHYLAVNASEQSNRSLVFETDGDQVIYIRIGRLPEAHWVERCG